ncbi:hypothetical protein [Rosenbergiella metrosideri]|uniref:hypothetical protein n=1 Tax=Rosenbergiella metrosideri TaxID=2921185 RepID=UPI001F4F7BBD|nr:hypothetical protein [Rosenbergiella metrosideri]
MKKFITAALMALFITGCSSNFGLNPETSIDNFDGSKVITLQPHGADCCISVGALWTSKSPDYVELNLVTYAKYMNLETAEVKADKDVINLQALDTITKLEQMYPESTSVNMPTSTRGFAISIADLRKLLAANTSMIRITTLSDGSLTGTLKDGNKSSAAYFALQRFISQLPQK